MTRDFSYGMVPLFRTEHQILVLLIQQQEGHWGFPKGHAEKVESPVQTAQRELEEETGVTRYELDESVVFSEEYYPVVNGEVVHKTVQYYPAWLLSQQVQVQITEVKDYGWFTLDEAAIRLTYDGAKKVLQAVKRYVQQSTLKW